MLRQVRFMRWWRNASQLRWMLHSFFTKIQQLSGYCILPALSFLLAKCVGVTCRFLGQNNSFPLKKSKAPELKKKNLRKLESVGVTWMRLSQASLSSGTLATMLSWPAASPWVATSGVWLEPCSRGAPNKKRSKGWPEAVKVSMKMGYI